MSAIAHPGQIRQSVSLAQASLLAYVNSHI
jgi:hypothetical protein